MKSEVPVALLFSLLCWNGGLRADGRTEQADGPSITFGIVHEGAIYASNLSLSVCRGDVFGKEIRIYQINQGIQLSGIHESIDFPPRWKIGGGALKFVDASPSPLPGARKRDLLTFNIPLTSIDQVITDQQSTQPASSLGPREVKVFEFSALLEDERRNDNRRNILDYTYEAVRRFVSHRDKVTTPDPPFADYEFFYDLLPVKKGPCDFVVLASEPLQEEIELTRKDTIFPLSNTGKWQNAKEPLKPMLGFWHKNEGGQWALVDKVKNPCFNERFHVFPDGTTYYFVTDSGKVYVSKKPDKGERKLEEVWIDKKRPINGAITDTASGKTFLFGAEGNDSPKLFYFELSEKPELCEFERKSLVDTKLLPPLDIPTTYAHLLAADKKIKIEPKPEPKPKP